MITFFEKYKHGIIILLLWLFAPLAWYLMWKDKKYHSWFPPLLLLNGFVFTIILAISLQSSSAPNLTLLFLIGSIIQILYGLSLRKKKLTEKVIEMHIPLILLFLIIDVIIGAVTGILSLLLPII